MKAETERSALDVKLKHARNQVDVEIKRRQRAEADCEKLVCIVFSLRTVTVGEGEAHLIAFPVAGFTQFLPPH